MGGGALTYPTTTPAGLGGRRVSSSQLQNPFLEQHAESQASYKAQFKSCHPTVISESIQTLSFVRLLSISLKLALGNVRVGSCLKVLEVWEQGRRNFALFFRFTLRLSRPPLSPLPAWALLLFPFPPSSAPPFSLPLLLFPPSLFPSLMLFI